MGGINSNAFIQPIIHDFPDSSIPVAFLKKLEPVLKGRQLKRVVFRGEKEGHENREWVVRIYGGRHFNSEDWMKLVKHYNLKAGGFLLFRHFGNFVFRVSVFDPTTSCESLSLPSAESSKKQQQEASRGRGKKPLGSCDVTITSYYSKRNIVHLPRQFVRENGLALTRCAVTLMDPKDRVWTVWLSYKACDGQSYINRGWKAFQEANGLKSGDVIRLQLVRGGKHPAFECHRCPKRWEADTEEEDDAEEEAEEEEASRRGRGGVQSLLSCCLVPITSSDADTDYLRLPKQFVQETGLGLRRCGVTLIDQKKRSWKVWLRYKDCDRRPYISGWKAIQEANCIEIGDVMRIRLLDAGKHPVFECCTSWEAETEEEEEDDDDDDDDEDEDDGDHDDEEEAEAENEAAVAPSTGQRTVPSCDLTITRHSAAKNIVYLPMKFVRENGLLGKRCLVSLMDQKKRSWKVWLQSKKSSGQSYMYRGWKHFRVAKRLKPGDVVRLQLFRAGSHPVFKCLISPKPREIKSEPESEELKTGTDREADVVPSQSSKGRGKRSLPSCDLAITSDNAARNVYLPKEFVKENGLSSKSCDVTIIDQKRRSWQVKLCYKNSGGQLYVNQGWKAFLDANNVKPGDVIRLRLLGAGNYPVFKCCRLSRGRRSAKFRRG